MLLDEIGAYLVAQGIATDPGSLFKGWVPDGTGVPDDVVVLLQLPGEPNVYTFGGGQAAIEKPRLKVIVRNTDSSTAESLCGQVARSLEVVANQSLSGTWYDHILVVRGPYQQPPYRDHKPRWLWAVEFRIQKAPS